MKKMSDDLENQLQIAANTLRDFADGPAKVAGETISKSFQTAGNEIAKSLANAARSGEISIKKLTSTILREISQMAFEKFAIKPIETAISQLFKGIPDIFQIANSGAINNLPTKLLGSNSVNAPVNITINMANGTNITDVRKSANQVGASLARLVNRGRGLL